MSGFVTNIFRRIKKIVGVTAIDATADTITEPGEDITFYDVTGNIWINPNATAVANATSFKMVAGNSLSFTVRSDRGLSIISDGTGGTYQYVVHGRLL